MISHTAHFHEHVDVGEWLLVAQEASYAGSGRVFGSGAVFTAGRHARVDVRAGQHGARGGGDDRPQTRDVAVSTDDDTGIEAELDAWLRRNWDPDLLVSEWWERVGDAGWTAPTFRSSGVGAGTRVARR